MIKVYYGTELKYLLKEYVEIYKYPTITKNKFRRQRPLQIRQNRDLIQTIEAKVVIKISTIKVNVRVYKSLIFD